jgi:hypothetical protein
MLERIPLDRSATPPSQQHSCSFPPTEAVQSSRLGRIICHGCRMCAFEKVQKSVKTASP